MRKFLFGFLILSILISKVAFAGPQVAQPASGYKTHAPQGSTDVNVLSVKIQAVPGDTSVSSMRITNTATEVKFGTGITKAYLYKDANSNHTFEVDSDALVSDKTFTASSTNEQTFDFPPVAITSNEFRSFFIVYDFADDASIGKQTSVEVLQIQGATVVKQNDGVTGNTVTVTGLSVTVNNVIDGILLPGQTLIPILKVTAEVVSENLAARDIEFVIKNDSGNFATASNSKTGITAVSIYWDGNSGDGTFSSVNDALIGKIVAGNFESASEAKFLSSDETFFSTMNNAAPITFFVVYDIGEDLAVSEDTKLQAQITTFSGIGSYSALTLSLMTATPKPPVSGPISGLGYSNVKGIASNNKFGPGSTVPMLQFDLTAWNAAVTVNSIDISNTQAVQFITNENTQTGITKIKLYRDGNDNDSFDGDNTVDTLIASKNLGVDNTATECTIPISIEGTQLPLLIPTDNTSTIFVVYDLGTGIDISADVSGNYTNKVDAQLKDVSANVGTHSIGLGGTLPAISSPNATVTLVAINLRLNHTQSLSPSSVRLGQKQVPMLIVNVTAEDSLTSVNVSISNNQSSFLGNGSGIEKVWLYKDNPASGAYGTFDDADIFLSATTTFEDLNTAFLPVFNIASMGEHQWLILYDIGSAASISQLVAGCQLKTIFAGDGGNVVFGGDVPSPKTITLATIESSLVRVNSLGASVTAISAQTNSFSVSINIENISTQDIRITQITPKFYLTTISGKDVSYDFTSTLTETIPVTLNTTSKQTFNFSVTPIDLIGNGSVILDAFVQYQTDPSSNFVIKRYQAGSGSWRGTVDEISKITFQFQSLEYNWQFPSYISSIQLAQKPFKNFDAVPANSSLFIQLKNKSAIDESSFQLSINSIPLSASSTGIYAPNTYFYHRDTGILDVFDLGDQDGLLTLSVKDLDGNLLEITNINFRVNSQIIVTDFLVYPSPYTAPSALTFGFNLTQPSTVDIYVYNAIGLQVWKNSTSFSEIGYHKVSWASPQITGGYLSTGIYFVRLVAEDSSGKKAYAKTKFSVY